MIALTFLALTLVMPEVSFAAATTLQGLANQVAGFLNASTTLIMLGGVLVFFYGTTSNIFKTSRGETREMRSYLLWGIFTLFIMFSIWGILSLLQNTLFGSGSTTSSGQSGNSGPTVNFNQ